ncbi:MAG: hypothetical protein ABW321_25340 [Polyangiales bacterium]
MTSRSVLLVSFLIVGEVASRAMAQEWQPAPSPRTQQWRAAQQGGPQPGPPAPAPQSFPAQPPAYPAQQQPYPTTPQGTFQQQAPQAYPPNGYQQQPGYYPGAAPGGYGQEGYAPQAPPGPRPLTSVAGAIQLGAGISLLSYHSNSLSPDTSMPMSMLPSDQAAASSIITNCCVNKTPFLVEAGYGLSDQALLGVQLQLAGASESISETVPSAREMLFSLGAKFDYQLTPTSRWNPFIGAVANVSLVSKSYYGTKDSRTLFGLLARAGLRYFVLDQLSIDPTVALGAHFGSGSQSVEVTPGPSQDYGVSGFDFALSLAVSLWIK